MSSGDVRLEPTATGRGPWRVARRPSGGWRVGVDARLIAAPAVVELVLEVHGERELAMLASAFEAAGERNLPIPFGCCPLLGKATLPCVVALRARRAERLGAGGRRPQSA